VVNLPPIKESSLSVYKMVEEKEMASPTGEKFYPLLGDPTVEWSRILAADLHDIAGAPQQQEEAVPWRRDVVSPFSTIR
jgi:hypothetical protein